MGDFLTEDVAEALAQPVHRHARRPFGHPQHLRDMYVGIDMYTNIKLGKIFFVKHASVQIGSYIYDEPNDPNDSRLTSYGEVPAIAFSEAMGDLGKISGKSKEQPAEAADA